jgi:hypothetical protein
MVSKERQMKARLQTEYGHPVDEIEIPYTQEKLPGVLLNRDRVFVFHELMGYPCAIAYYRENTIHVLGSRFLEVKLVYQGKEGEYTVRGEFSGDAGIYDELRVSIFNPQDECVGDAFFTLTEDGEPRALLTTKGNGDGDHDLVWFPLRETGKAVESYA